MNKESVSPDAIGMAAGNEKPFSSLKLNFIKNFRLVKYTDEKNVINQSCLCVVNSLQHSEMK